MKKIVLDESKFNVLLESSHNEIIDSITQSYWSDLSIVDDTARVVICGYVHPKSIDL